LATGVSLIIILKPDVLSAPLLKEIALKALIRRYISLIFIMFVVTADNTL
jgi:hypothetical protein